MQLAIVPDSNPETIYAIKVLTFQYLETIIDHLRNITLLDSHEEF